MTAATTNGSTRTVLTKSQIREKLAKTNKRGSHPQLVGDFLRSGEPWLVVNETVGYSLFTRDELKSKVQGIKLAYSNIVNKNAIAGVTDTPKVSVLFDEETGDLLLVNEDALAASEDESEDEL